MSTTQTVLTVLIVACLLYVAVSFAWQHRRPRRPPGRHRATGVDRGLLRGLIADRDAAAEAAQQRMAAAMRRETGR